MTYKVRRALIENYWAFSTGIYSHFYFSAHRLHFDVLVPVHIQEVNFMAINNENVID